MYPSLLFALLVGVITREVQARVLDPSVIPSSSTTTTSTTVTVTVSPSPSQSQTIVIAGSCGQDTLQYCCPYVQATPGEDSVTFANACECSCVSHFHERDGEKKGCL